ncbi:hypothetical protein L7F22_031413 [Adiantum nelumboides]|nr:hypothetical protein [Adiantum nelumboides]
MKCWHRYQLTSSLQSSGMKKENIKTTIMPREIWTLHQRPEVTSAVRAVHLEQFFRLPPWMRAHELMSSIQYNGKAMLTDSDGAKVEVLITKEIINDALQFIPSAYDLIPKTKAIDNEKAFLKVKGNKFKYSNLIYSELELPLRLISQHLRVQKPPRYTEPFLHMAVVMVLCVAERRQVHCDFAKYNLESLIKANLKNSAKNKLYMNAGPMLTRVAYQALGMIEDLPAASSQAALVQQAKYIPKAIKTTSSTASSRSTRLKKSSNQKAQEEAEAAQAAQAQETEIVDLNGTIEYLKKLEREKHTAEQRAAQLAREKIKEALSRKAEEPVLEPTQGSPKRPRQEEEEEIEHIQADPIPPSPINIPPAPPSSPITPFPPASTPQTPPSSLPLDIPKSPLAPTSPQQQHFSAEPIEVQTLQEETAQPMDKVEEEKQTDREQHQPTKVDVPILIVQEDEPNNEEAVQEVKSFDYTKLIQTLSRQFQCQQCSCQYAGGIARRTANGETETTFYLWILSQTAQHKAKVKQLEEELARAKAELEAVGSLASTSQIHQAETHLPIQPPQMTEMPEFQGTEEEEQLRPAPGALDIREQMKQEIEDMPKGPTKEYLMYEKKVMESVALAFLQPEEQIKYFGSDFLPLPLMRHEANLWKEKMRPAVPRNEDGGYEGKAAPEASSGPPPPPAADSSAHDNTQESLENVLNGMRERFDLPEYTTKIVTQLLYTTFAAVLAWLVMPRVFRMFHRYFEDSSYLLLHRSEKIPYELSFWAALEDPAKIFITVVAFSQLSARIAPTTIASQYLL